MRVLLLLDTPHMAGTEAHLLALAEALGQFEVTPVAACVEDSPLWNAVGTTRIERLALPRSLSPWSARDSLGRAGCDLLHAHNGRTTFRAFLAASGRYPIIATQHFIEPAHAQRSGLAGGLMRAAHHFVNRRLQRIICVSDAVREALLKRERLPESLATTIPNGISDRTQSGTSDREQLRRELGLKTDAPLIACVSRLEQEKNVTCLISAMAAVAGQFSDAVCLIVGDGSQMGLLTDQCNASGLTDNIRLLGFRNDAMAIMDIADLIVLPSRAEPFGLVLLEAMSLEKPVVAINAGGPREIVVDQETGFLVPPSDPAALAKAISRLLTDNQLRTEMGKRGYQRFQSCYTASRMAESTARVYRDVLQEFHAGRPAHS